MKSIFSHSNFRAGCAWIFLILGLILYWCGYFVINRESVWKEVAIKFGDVLVIGVILGYLTTAAEMLGVFKRELQNIICGKEFLNNQKDINPLWEAVSKQMFKEKFPSIHKNFLKVIKGYFPAEEVSYYNDYEVHTTVEWEDKENHMIKVTDDTRFELISETDKEFIYPLKSWITTKSKRKYPSTVKEFLINGEPPKIKEKKDYYEEDNYCEEKYIRLKGNTKYEISHKKETVYNLSDDYFIGFRAKYIVNNFRVSLDLPEGIEAIFICRGTQEDFKYVKNTKKSIETTYKGVILPRQGYIFALRELTI